MRIGPTLGVSMSASRLAASARRRVRPGERGAATGEETARGRALVPVEPAVEREETTARLVRHRTDAAFLAQLLAGGEGWPESRRVGRTDSRVATAAYDRARREEVRLEPGWLVDRAG